MRPVLLVFIVAALPPACGGSDANAPSGESGGGDVALGGRTSAGGSSLGGTDSATDSGGATLAGGDRGTGGVSESTGGNSVTIGGSYTGGTRAVGGTRASTGGASLAAGSTFTGGTRATGGSRAATTGGARAGGTRASGGASGGTRAAVGGSATGGSKATSTSTGGASATGGTKASGGANGGSSATGGTTGSTGGAAGATSCTQPPSGSKGSNPLFTDVFTADPAPFVHDCTFYITCGHDEGAGNYFTIYEWFLLKSTDMVHWTRTVGMRYTVFSWAHGNAWAGQMVAKGGKFYWYVPVEQGNGNGQMAIGVAVADSPEGPFEDAIGKPLVDDAFERLNMGFATDGDTPYTIDPTVFVDDDGQAYLHYGGFQRMVNAKLGADMISISGTMKESTPACYFEAPFLTKRNGTYYEIYACGVNPPTIDYATSNSPLGPWAHKGTVLPKMATLSGQDAATNHAGVAQRGDQWYIVYHVSNGPNGGGTYHREVAIDKMNFNADGSIQQVVPSSGLTF